MDPKKVAEFSAGTSSKVKVHEERKKSLISNSSVIGPNKQSTVDKSSAKIIIVEEKNPKELSDFDFPPLTAIEENNNKPQRKELPLFPRLEEIKEIKKNDKSETISKKIYKFDFSVNEIIKELGSNNGNSESSFDSTKELIRRITLQIQSFSLILVYKKIYTKKNKSQLPITQIVHEYCVEDNPALNFVKRDLQPLKKKEMNKEYEEMAIKILSECIHRCEIVTQLRLDSTTYNFTYLRFYSFLFKTFPSLEQEFNNNENLSNKLFYKKLFGKRSFQIDGGFIFNFNQTNDLSRPLVVELNKKKEVNARVKDFNIKFTYPCLMIVEVSTSKDVEYVVKKIRQLVINMVVSWYFLLERFSLENSLLEFLKSTGVTFNKVNLLEVFRNELNQMPKYCLFISGGDFNETQATFNKAYEEVSNDNIFKIVKEKLSFFDVSLAPHRSKNKQAGATLKERENLNFKVQNIYIPVEVNEPTYELMSKFDTIIEEVQGLSNQNVQMFQILNLIANKLQIELPDTSK